MITKWYDTIISGFSLSEMKAVKSRPEVYAADNTDDTWAATDAVSLMSIYCNMVGE